MNKSFTKVAFDPNEMAAQYYFGDLGYWKLPTICADALEHGFDGNALRRLAGLIDPVAADIRPDEVDSAFREMGVNAPIRKDEARLALAAEAAKRALSGESNVFDEATHIRIYLCELHQAPPVLLTIVALSAESKNAPRRKWKKLENRLRVAMSEFLSTRE